MNLEEKRKKYDIPAIPYLPKAQNVLVWRIEVQRKSAGGLHLPDVWTEKDQDGRETAAKKPPPSRGILLAAGCEAMDELAEGLIEIGDEVCCAHYAGRDRNELNAAPGEVAKSVWEMKVQDILGSVEAVERSKDYEMVLCEDDEGNRWHIWRKK